MDSRAERRGRRVRRARSIPLRRVLPNLLTTLSLCSGLASLHFSLEAHWDRAIAAIAVAAVFDVLDGGAARLLRASSKFGAVLDSLSDFLSFGVAPALVMHEWMLKSAGAGGLAATMTFVLCSALRLARFTSARRAPTGSPLSRYFVGMPTPAAAGAVLIPAMLYLSEWVGYAAPSPIVIAYTLAIALLMISRQPMFSLKKLRIPRRVVPLLLVATGLLVALASKDVWLAGVAVFGGYLCTLPLSIGAYRRARRGWLHASAPAREAAPGAPLATVGG